MLKINPKGTKDFQREKYTNITAFSTQTECCPGYHFILNMSAWKLKVIKNNVSPLPSDSQCVYNILVHSKTTFSNYSARTYVIILTNLNYEN